MLTRNPACSAAVGLLSSVTLSPIAVACSGHTLSWGRGYPELLTPCYTNGAPNGELGPLNPASNGTYEALWALIRETASLFPDSYLHLGGDEVPFECWEVSASFRVKGFRV